MKITPRATSDPGGKAVDVFPGSGSVVVVWCDSTANTTREALADLIGLRMRELHAAKPKLIANRDVPVWYADLTRSDGARLAGVCLSEGMADAPRSALIEPLYDLDEYWDMELGRLEHLEPEPLVRWQRGVLIAYGDPMAGPGDGPTVADELRSFDIADKPRPAKRPPPTLEVPIHGEHTIQSWADVSLEAEMWAFDLLEPMSYASLRRTIEDRLGIPVHEEPDLANVGEYGCLRTGWRLGEDACSVRILMAPHHHDDLKYVILAHELGHFCRHFPYLFHRQLVEELSWATPEIGVLFQAIVESAMKTVGADIEDDANAFASGFLLVPQLFPVSDWAGGTFAVDSPLRSSQVLFDGLQPFFPDRRAGFDAMTFEERRDEAAATFSTDLASTDEHSLYLSMVRACALREAGRDSEVRDALSEAIAAAIEAHLDLMEQCMEATRGWEPSEERRWWQGVLEELGIDPVAAAIDSAPSELEAGRRRILRPPLDWDGASLYQTIPLIAESWNPEGDLDGEWRCLIDPGQPTGTFEEYHRARPDIGLAIYRPETWERADASGSGAR